MRAQRFGLGFNAVYHLTDVPSFVSGDHIVMFDPHARYLPGISPAQPGLKIAFERGNLVAQVRPPPHTSWVEGLTLQCEGFGVWHQPCHPSPSMSVDPWQPHVPGPYIGSY